MNRLRPMHFTLHPGDVAIGERGDSFETLLGSCVAIVLTDPRRTAGAMCHIVHSGTAARREPASGASAAVALATMERLLRERGLSPGLCEAYVYGGGNMFPQLDDAPNVGDHNAEWALRALQELGVTLLEADVRGAVYRRLRWTVGRAAPRVESVSLLETP
jgi:chemotaxis protein CheD